MDANSNSMFTCALPLANCQTQIVQVHFRGEKLRPEFFLLVKFLACSSTPAWYSAIKRRNKFLFAAMQRLHFNNK